MNKPLVGIVAVAMIFLSAGYIGVSTKNGQGFLTSSVLDSQTKEVKAKSDTLDAKELFGLVRSLNNEIERVASGEEVKVTVHREVGIQENEKAIGQQISAVELGAVYKAEIQLSPSEEVNQIEPVAEVKTETVVQTTTKKVVDQEKLKRLLVERHNFMVMLAKADARLFLLVVLRDDVRATIPTNLQDEIESSVTLTGEIEVIHHDDFKHEENDYFEYHLWVNKKRLNFYPTGDLSMLSRTVLKIAGKIIGDVFVANNSDITMVSAPSDAPDITQTTSPFGTRGPGPQPQTVSSVGPQRTLVILIKFQDSGTPPVAPMTLQDHIFNGPFERFYEEQSYNQVSFTGDVSGWFTLPRNGPMCPDYPYANNEAANIISDNGIDLGQYDRLVLVYEGGYCADGFVGKSDVNINQNHYLLSVSRVGTSFSPLVLNSGPNSLEGFDNTLAHEIGHNLGVMHANGWDCGGNVVRGNHCSHVEYGNYFDVMGSGFTSKHFNAFYKNLLGWIPSQNQLIITQSGRYTINTFETPITNPTKKFARVQQPNMTPFFLEYRKAFGFDSVLNNASLTSNQNGLMVNQIIYPHLGNPFPHFLDMQPTSASWYTDLNQSTLNTTVNTGLFNDPPSGVKVGPIISTTPSSITFDVNLQAPVCYRSDPIVSFEFPPVPIGVGGYEDWYVNFGNADSVSCGPSRLNIETNIQSSWLPEVSPRKDINIMPTESGVAHNSKEVKFRVPSTLVPGTYPVTITAVNRTSGRTKNLTTNVEVKGPPIVTGISPSSGHVGTQITLTGSNFSSNPTIQISHVDGYYELHSSSNGSSVTFVMPSSILGHSCGDQCLIPSPPGYYSIFLSSDGIYADNVVYFTVTP